MTLRTLVGIGLPSFLANIGLIVLVNDTLAVTGGATALTAYAVCSRLQTFAVMPHTGMSQGLQPFVSHNTGRGPAARVARTRRLALWASLVYGAATAILLTVLAEPLVGIFVSGGETAREARFALRVIALGGIVTGVAPLTAACFQALGRPLPAYIPTVGPLLVLKAPLVVACGHLRGAHGVWSGLAAGEFATAASALLLLHRTDRRTPPVAGTASTAVVEAAHPEPAAPDSPAAPSEARRGGGRMGFRARGGEDHGSAKAVDRASLKLFEPLRELPPRLGALPRRQRDVLRAVARHRVGGLRDGGVHFEQAQ
ncbi:MATE family efflux transporter [Streptomyces sp. NPDC058625]|uniref:MATE family efflux transporter n=1 Tax=Streptomyces sp. NPDC058625 TaxID=3346564 RepID=UPI00365712A9